MKRSLLCRVVGVVALACLSDGAFAQSDAAQKHWPHWRGPLANGVAPQGDPPLRWSETENIKWKYKIPGLGHGTPVIWGEKVFLLTAMSTGQGAGGGNREAPSAMHQWIVLCLERNTGKLLWQKVAREEVPHEGHHQDHGFASASPLTDGQQLYVSFGSRGIYCHDFDGNLKWERQLGKMRTRNGFGEGVSPAVHGDKLIINWDHEGEDFITALDTKTGKTLWKTDRDEPTTWNTPLIIPGDKQTQVVVGATVKTRSYDLATGKQIWECAGQVVNVIPSPVVGHGLVFVMSGHRGASLQAIRYDRTGDLSGTDAIAWSLNKATPYVSSPLLYDDLLYFFSHNNNILSCYEAKTGKVLIDATRIEGMSGVYASPVGAAGRVYLLSRNGTAVVIKKGPQLEILATNKLNDGFEASPAITGKELFLRGREHLYCIAEK